MASCTLVVLFQYKQLLKPYYWLSLVDEWSLQRTASAMLRSASARTCVVPRTHDSFGDRSFGSSSGAAGQVIPNIRDGVEDISLTPLPPNNVWVMCCCCFCPVLRSTFSYVKRTKMQDFNQNLSKIFRDDIPSRTFPVPRGLFKNS